MCGTRLADFHRLAESLGKGGAGFWRGACADTFQTACPGRTTIDTIAEFLLGCANLGQEGDRIERAILIAKVTVAPFSLSSTRTTLTRNTNWSPTSIAGAFSVILAI